MAVIPDGAEYHWRCTWFYYCISSVAIANDGSTRKQCRLCVVADIQSNWFGWWYRGHRELRVGKAAQESSGHHNAGGCGAEPDHHFRADAADMWRGAGAGAREGGGQAGRGRGKMTQLLEFLGQLEERGIYYKLNKVRDSIMVEVAVPGQRWEIEFFSDGHVEIEKFLSSGTMYGEEEIGRLFEEFSD